VEDYLSDLSDIDETPADDFDTIDDENPPSFRPSPPPSPPPKRVKREVKLEDIPKRNHHRHGKRRDRRNTTIRANGHVARPATLKDHVSDRNAIHSTLDASTLPSTHGAYAAKVEDTRSKYGSKKRRTLTELIALGFRLVKWDGMCVILHFFSPHTLTCTPVHRDLS
jgi:hypothetical protein